jgi:hypothetical protein
MAEITLTWDKVGARSTGANGRDYAETIGQRNMIVGDLMIESQAPDGKTTAIFEDNGKVAYCYILENGKIISDVWLYNREKTPSTEPWKMGSSPPYLNPADYSKDIIALPEATDIHLEWNIEDGVPVALVVLFGKVFGRISSLTKPGYARLAFKDGPLARAMRSNMLSV